MKQLLFCLVPVMLLAGCAQETELPEPVTGAGETEEVIRTQPRSLEGAVYNEVTDSWMIPQNDPQVFTRAAQSGEPTHYALKIYPKSEEEQWRVEMMKDVQVSYIPFGYTQLTQKEVEDLPQAKTRPAANTFPEKSPYTVTYDNDKVTDGGPTGTQTFQLPILYTLWPVEKPLPDDLEYVVDHEVFQPYTGSSASTRAYYTGPYPIQLTTYDNSLGDYVPLANLKVTVYTDTYSFSWGSGGYHWSYSLSTVTDANGMIDIGPGISGFSSIFPNSSSCPIYISREYMDTNGKWKITPGNSTAPILITDSYSVNFPDGQSNVISFPAGDRRENVIHRGVNYFYNGQTVFPKHYPSGGTIIRAYGSYGRPYYVFGGAIVIYNRGDDGLIMGDTLHEIGHLVHYENNPAHFGNTHTFLYESFASYVGWYAGENYYRSVGWTGTRDITYYNRQGWTKTTSVLQDGHYSPLFIDLIEDHNQSTVNADRPNDEIKNVPPSVLWNTITTGTNWAQCRAKLLNYAGTGTGKYYTTAQFNDWIVDFDNWVGW